MFASNFELNNAGYFYTLDISKVAIEEEKVSSGGKDAKWPIHAGHIKTNIYILMEHPDFEPLLKSRARLIQNFKAAKSDEAKEALENFMKDVIDVLTDVLKLAHNQYWKDAAKKIRSPYTFEQCIKKATDFGREKLEILNHITDTKTSSNVLSTVINGQLDEIARSRLKQLGASEDKVMSKKSKKTK